jgi:DNA-binding NarL/FixJ family response regulator
MPHSLARVLVADSHSLSAIGISEIFQDLVGIKGVTLVEEYDRLCAILDADEQWSLLTLEMALPGLGGLAGLRTLRSKYPSLRVAIVANDSERSLMLGALGEGAHGYIPKDLPAKEIAIAFRQIIAGHIYVPDRLADLTAPAESPPPARGSVDHLTERQRDVLSFVRRGYTNKEIARALAITESTVKVHLASAFRQLGVHNRASAVAVLEGLNFKHRVSLGGPIASEPQKVSQSQNFGSSTKYDSLVL